MISQGQKQSRQVIFTNFLSLIFGVFLTPPPVRHRHRLCAAAAATTVSTKKLKLKTERKAPLLALALPPLV